MDVSFHSLLRLVHIAAGSLGLVFFWIPIFAKKGGRVHLAAGRVFVWLSMVIVATAVVSCVWALAAPIHFSGITRELTAGEIEHLSGRIRFFFSVLGVLTTWFVASMRVGIRAVRTRQDPSQLGDRWTRVTVAISVVASIAAILGGATMYYVTGELRAFALVGLGVFGTLEGRKTWRLFAKTDHGKMDWWYLHMESMLGLGIAFHTAFFVFGGSRIWGDLQGVWVAVPWALPTVIGVAASHFWTNSYRRKFECRETSQTSGSSSLASS